MDASEQELVGHEQVQEHELELELEQGQEHERVQEDVDEDVQEHEQGQGHEDEYEEGQHKPSHTRFTEESRSLYVGHLPNETNYYDLCKAAYEFGPLELVRLVPKKKCAFLNFLYIEDAKRMMEVYKDSLLPHPEDAETDDHVLKIFGKPVRLSWSETRPLQDDILSEISENKASRSLFVFYGNCIKQEPNQSVITSHEIAEKFRTFGNIENIVIKPKKMIAFVNMTSISAAIAALKAATGEVEDDPELSPEGLLLRGARLVVKYSDEEKARENYTHERNDPRNQPFSYNSHYNYGHNQRSQGYSRMHGMNDFNSDYGSGMDARMTQQVAHEPQLPPGWMESIDDKSGCKYYYNSQKKITQWEHPVTGKPSPPVTSHPTQYGHSNTVSNNYGNSYMNGQTQGHYGSYGGSHGQGVNHHHQQHSTSSSTPNSRAIIVQNLPTSVDYARLCTLGRQYGMIESVRLHSDKGMGFINYVDNTSAANLFRQANMTSIVMDGSTLKIGWAKEVPIKGYLYEAIVQDGANRSIYLRDLSETITEAEVREEFAKYSNGEIESIILRPNEKPFGFVNFIDIVSAKKVIDAAKKQDGYLEFNNKAVQVSYVNSKRIGSGARYNNPSNRNFGGHQYGNTYYGKYGSASSQ